MIVDIVGEDAVTQEILCSLLSMYRKDIIIGNKLPARGGQIRKIAPLYNKMERNIIMLTDLDEYDCAPSLINDWFDDQLSKHFIFRIAFGEAESWLMSDRMGFSSWLSIDHSKIPMPEHIDRRNLDIIEIKFPYKPSLFLMIELASISPKKSIKDMLAPKLGSKKGPAYNSALLPFIRDHWNIEEARKNSYSLDKAIKRIQEFNE